MDPKIFELIRADGRYAYKAYDFVCEAVTYTQDALGRAPQEDDDPDTDYHVSGEELVRGACELAIQDFGMMAPVVFRHWGLLRSDDFGEIVFQLVQASLLSQSDRDEPEDFCDLFDLEKTLTLGFDLTLSETPDLPRGPR